MCAAHLQPAGGAWGDQQQGEWLQGSKKFLFLPDPFVKNTGNILKYWKLETLKSQDIPGVGGKKMVDQMAMTLICASRCGCDLG